MIKEQTVPKKQFLKPQKSGDIDDPLDPKYGEKNYREKDKKKSEDSSIIAPPQ